VLEVLDKWDFAIIRLCKTQSCHLDVAKGLTDLWADRCALELQDVHYHDIVRHLMRLVENINPRGMSGLVDYFISYANEEGGLRAGRLVELTGSYCISKLTVTAVSDIPGYREYLDSLDDSE